MNPNDPRLVALRLKSKREGLTFDELSEAITLMREGRVIAHAVSARAKVKKDGPDSNALLEEFSKL